VSWGGFYKYLANKSGLAELFLQVLSLPIKHKHQPFLIQYNLDFNLFILVVYTNSNTLAHMFPSYFLSTSTFGIAQAPIIAPEFRKSSIHHGACLLIGTSLCSRTHLLVKGRMFFGGPRQK
jgi:hypothetical protein